MNLVYVNVQIFRITRLFIVLLSSARHWWPFRLHSHVTEAWKTKSIIFVTDWVSVLCAIPFERQTPWTCPQNRQRYLQLPKRSSCLQFWWHREHKRYSKITSNMAPFGTMFTNAWKQNYRDSPKIQGNVIKSMCDSPFPFVRVVILMLNGHHKWFKRNPN